MPAAQAALNRVDYDIAMEIASHEAVIRQTYKDGGGVNTWSVGMTSATGHNVDRYIGKPQSIQHCMNVYAWALENYAAHVREVMGPVPKHVFAGTLSWTWNLGAKALRTASWVKHYKAGRMAEAERTFKLWNKDNGKVVPGLVSRRAKEADLIFRGKWSNTGQMTEYTRLSKTGTPVWSSAVKVDVSREIKAAFITPVHVTQDKPKLPDAVPAAPTVSPTGGKSPLGALVAVVVAIVGAAYAFARSQGWLP